MIAPRSALGLMLAMSMVSAPAYAKNVSQAEIDGFMAQVKSCWAVAPEDIASGLRVKVRLNLDEEGNVSEIDVLTPYKSVTGQRLAAGAVRALQRCAPYSFSAESYEHWKTLDIDLQP